MSYASDFAMMRQMVGNPTMTCIDARSGWAADNAVPAGYTYDADYDVYMDESGNTWKPDAGGSWGSGGEPSTEVDILPSTGLATLELVSGGIIDTGNRTVRILPADLSTVTGAQWIELDGYTYDVEEASPFPAGNALWYTVRLRKR